MGQPKFKLGDRVRITPGHELEGRVGMIGDPDSLRRTKPRWPETYWKAESTRIYYWIEFATPVSTPGDLCAAEVDEAHLVPA